MIFVNFKTYEQGTGERALDLVRILENASEESQIKIIPVLQAADLKEASLMTKLEIWAQHTDPVEFGAHTGSTLAEALKEDGAMGVFLNHSEHKFNDFESLKAAHEHAKSIGLKTLIFAGDLEELKKVLTLEPDFASYEPPELVGSTTTSVSEAKPEVVKEAVEICREARIPLIVGAGIKSEKDILVGLELGALGFAVASDIVKAEHPEERIKELLKGFN